MVIGGYVVSVIIPMNRPSALLPKIRSVLSNASVPVQILIVLNNPTPGLHVAAETPHEEVIFSPKQGRGYAFLKGFERAKGKVIFLLHADTIPPSRWEKAILKALEDPHVVGGGFSLKYDQYRWYLSYGSHFIDLVFRATGEIYGDRGIFVRRKILHKCLAALDVPLFEDVKLSQCLRSHGKIVMLKTKITASTKEFLKYGMLGNIKRYITCRLWYAFGASPQKLYRAYYKTK